MLFLCLGLGYCFCLVFLTLVVCIRYHKQCWSWVKDWQDALWYLLKLAAIQFLFVVYASHWLRRSLISLSDCLAVIIVVNISGDVFYLYASSHCELETCFGEDISRKVKSCIIKELLHFSVTTNNFHCFLFQQPLLKQLKGLTLTFHTTDCCMLWRKM